LTIEDKSLETVNEEKLREENEERDLTEPSKPELVNDYDPERRKLAMEYTRASRTYSLKLLILSLVVSVLILLSKITVMLNDFIVKNISADPVIVVGLFFTIGFTLLSMIELPFSFYSHIRFGKKYGLSKLNNRQWFFRHLKGEVLGFILTFIIFEGFYWILRVVTSTWWVWATIIMILFSIVLSALVPVLILPRFYKFESLENTHPELTKELLDLANQAGFKAKNVFNWKLGAVATVGNAALMGLGSTRRIVISDTMLDQYTSEEIKWILAHELGHHVRRCQDGRECKDGDDSVLEFVDQGPGSHQTHLGQKKHKKGQLKDRTESQKHPRSQGEVLLDFGQRPNHVGRIAQKKLEPIGKHDEIAKKGTPYEEQG